MKSGTLSQHSFSNVARAEIQRSSFNRSHGHKTTFDVGDLIPIHVDEILPGDTVSLQMFTFARLATLLHPILDNLRLTSFFFFVPTRLVWDNFEKFNGAQTDPGDSTDFLVPQMPLGVGGALEGSLSDYFGIPTQVDMSVNSLVHRSHNLIYNEWFRDENLIDSVVVDRDDTPDDPADYLIYKRGKRHDYFTACLPWPQKGPSVTLPLGDYAPVIPAAVSNIPVFQMDGDLTAYNLKSNNASPLINTRWTGSPGNDETAEWLAPNLRADLGAATAATINELRQAFQIQKLYERDARGGTRYTELIRSHFGVSSPDQRLQRPEYLGGGTQTINATPVPQTSETGTTPQGVLAAFATSAGSNHGFNKSFTEHGHIIGYVCVTADLSYQQGLNRLWSRQTRWDYYWPALAHIGEQAVLNKELFADGSAADDLVFGYQERFSEYRHFPSLITGAMRSNAATSLDTWHLAQDFPALPVLDETFINEDPPVARVIAVPSEPHMKFDSFMRQTHTRPMPTYGTPGQMDRF